MGKLGRYRDSGFHNNHACKTLQIYFFFLFAAGSLFSLGLFSTTTFSFGSGVFTILGFGSGVLTTVFVVLTIGFVGVTGTSFFSSVFEKNSRDLTGSGLIVSFPGLQFAGHTSPFLSVNLNASSNLIVSSVDLPTGKSLG
jgi:hypothetical protein